MKRKFYSLLLCFSLMLFCTGMIYAMASVTITNDFETGFIDISVTEYQKDDSGEGLWGDNPVVLPGDEISNISRIHNNGNDCYVRAKIGFDTEEGLSKDDLSGIQFFGIEDTWVEAEDGYLYYTEVLTHGEDVDIFQGIKVPEDLAERTMGKSFTIDVNVDAIQSKNFNPEFASATPWGNVQILKYEENSQTDIAYYQGKETFKIVYQGDVGNLVANSENFFSNFPALMPGDVYSDTVKLENDGSKDIKIYFRSNAASDDTGLLEKIQLTISTEIGGTSSVLYEGNLKADKLSEDVILGIIPKGDTANLSFEIAVPEELGNEYAALKTSSVKWIFSTEPIVDDVPGVDNPSTGDSSTIFVFIAVMMLSLIGIVFALNGLKKSRKGENDYDEV